MGARAAEEDKAKDLGTLYHEPTIKPGLGSSRCPRCFSPISNNSVPSLNPKPYYTHGRPKLNFIVLFQVYILIIQQDISGWTMAPVVRDTFTMVGTTAGGTLGAFHGFNRVMPFVQSCVRGPMWLHFFIGGLPCLLLPKFQFLHIMQPQLLHITQFRSSQGVLKALLLVTFLEMNLANTPIQDSNMKLITVFPPPSEK
ncbi:uncharacterized protein LOC131054147 isoform X2 [Cryptomeria japonica]|uniref:uncharacterized protein LOC131054147 isoform X2 n=1 Tax=Cryptomeria japonica TaxID=3369 RepID=UPI0027DA8157|nr:uncharacterized protein LOC131054147 isoform X2 [Cryptomeria japonica]